MQQKINQAQSEDFKGKWNMLVHNIVRPPRKLYRLSDLGSKQFTQQSFKFIRQDFDVHYDNKLISLSIFTATIRNNSSNKLQAIQLLKYIPEQFSLACFDFFGCGLNQMQTTISLGIRQAEQTRVVVTFLRNLNFKVVIWGRSMGAVTALIYGDCEIIVADSPFLSFKKTCQQLTYKYTPLFLKPCICCFFNCFYLKLRSDVKERANYNIDDLNIKKAVSKIKDTTTLIFLSAINDQMISPQTSAILLQSFKGKNKHLQVFVGTHNSKRPPVVIKKVMDTILTNLGKNRQKIGRMTQLTDFYCTLDRMKE